MYPCGANFAALSSYACMKPSMMSFAASRFSATEAPLWEQHHPRTRCSTAEAASSPILADAIVFGSITFERIVEYRSNTSAKDSAMTVYEPGSVDDVVRYQANKHAKEGDAAFARACGEFARNDAFRSLNETIIANVGRDRDKGAMFARVPTGTETCTFCLMLASRGAVYHTRKTAGEWGHFHRRCDYKVVPSFEGDPDAELVQGVKPRELYERYKQFKEIDGYGLPRVQEDALKAAYADAAGDGVFSRARSDSELAACFDAGVKDAVKRFRKSKTIGSYDATVNAYLSLLGDAYGIELAGERYANSKGRCNGADPNGEELWIAVKARLSGTYLYASHEHPSVDFETESGLVEFKTPRSIRKVNDLLVNASRKFDAYPGEKKAVVVSLLRLPNAEEKVLTAAANFTRDGTLDEVVVLGQDGARLN